MNKIPLSAFDLAQRFVGLAEVPGPTASPQVLAMLRLDEDWPDDDLVPWCSAFVNYVGFFAGREGGSILLLGGNQGDSVGIARFPENRLLGIRRLG